MTADYAALEARVAELEHLMRHILPAKVDAVSFGVSVMHGEMTEQFGQLGERIGRMELRLDGIDDRLDGIDNRLDGHDRSFDALSAKLDRQAATLTDHGHLLAEIIRRLPTQPGE